MQRQTALWHSFGFLIAVLLLPFRICFRPVVLLTQTLGLILLFACSQVGGGTSNSREGARNETAAALHLIVTNTADSGAGSLRFAIATSNAAPASTGCFNTIAFSIPPSDPGYVKGVATITLTSGELLLETSVAIRGPGADRVIIQRTTAEGAARFRIFHNADGMASQISGLTITNGNAAVNLSGGTFIDGGSGGGILVDGGNLTVSDCIITGNSSVSGGAGLALSGHFWEAPGLPGTTLTITNCLVKGNSCEAQAGGGVKNEGGYNSATHLIVTGSVIENNTGGGGIYNFGGSAGSTASVIDCTIRGNVGGIGGGIGNTSSGGGSADMTIRNTTISENMPSLGYCGLINGASGGRATLVVSNSTITGNLAERGSAGIANNSGAASNASVTLNNCTITGNSVPSANGSGLAGGIYNHAAQGGTSAIILNGTIVANNFAGTSDDEIYNQVDAGGSATISGSYNVVGTLGGYSFASGSNNLLGVDPMFERDDKGSPLLKDNGGRTRTVALLPDSPAIDAGDPGNILRRDQRGYARSGVGDIGAYEWEGTALRISQIARSNSDLAVTFNALAGETYRLERALDLANANWEATSGAADLNAISDGPVQMIDHEASLQTGAYYRVRLLP